MNELKYAIPKFSTTKDMSWLRPIFKAWFDVIDKYSRILKYDDVGWWYNERASVGLFASAFTKCNWVVLEEYSTEKVPKKGRIPASGRQDFFATNGRVEVVAEAKHDFKKLSDKSSTCTLWFEGILDRAEDDMSQNRIENAKKLSVAFCYLKSPVECVEDTIAIWIQSLKDLKNCSYAYTFPSELRKFASDKKNENGKHEYPGHCFPGASVIVRNI